MKKTYLMQLIETRYGRPLEDVIQSLSEAGHDQQEIADQLGIPYATLRNWLMRLQANTVISFPKGSEEVAAH